MPYKVEDDGFNCSTSEAIEIETSMPAAYMAIEVTTNAFAPAFCKGDRILLADRFPYNGERAVFVNDGIGYLRKYIEVDGRYILQPLTGHDKPEVYRRPNQFECIGTYIGVIPI